MSCIAVFTFEIALISSILYWLIFPMCPNIYFFFPIVCWNFSVGLLHFQKCFLVCGLLSTQYFPGAPGPWLRRARAGSQVAAGSTGRIEVCMSTTQHTRGQDSSWVLWHIMLDPTSLTKELLFMDACQIVLRGKYKQGTSYLATLIINPLGFLLEKSPPPLFFVKYIGLTKSLENNLIDTHICIISFKKQKNIFEISYVFLCIPLPTALSSSEVGVYQAPEYVYKFITYTF